MIGARYWSTGIICTWTSNAGGGRGPGWGAHLKFLDSGFSGDDDPAAGVMSTEGELRTRYYAPVPEGLAAALDVLIADASRLGIEFRSEMGGPMLYIADDVEEGADEYPFDWRTVLTEQATRLGWATYGTDAVAVDAGQEQQS